MKIGKSECRISYSYQGLTSRVVETFNRMVAEETIRRERNDRK